MKPIVMTALTLALLAGPAMAATPVVAPLAAAPADLVALPMHTGGRVLTSADGYAYQWPGTYFEAAFKGQAVYFKTGTGDEDLHVTLDGEAAAPLVKPAAGLYMIGNLAAGPHTVRIDIVNESQAGADSFGGFAIGAGAQPSEMPARRRQIEFIGDSHTVGYGNTSTTRNCTTDDVWNRTDSSQAFGPEMARRYDADYQINAISGHGIVRNYNGSAGDPVPVAYPFVLLDHTTAYRDDTWQPQVIVMALGTNDFTTALNPGEKWTTRDQLHADYEATYAAFLKALRARNPKAYFVLWATDMADGEIEAEEQRVVAQAQAAGDRRIQFIPVNGLALTGCHQHPSLGDHKTIAGLLEGVIDAQPDIWQGK